MHHCPDHQLGVRKKHTKEDFLSTLTPSAGLGVQNGLPVITAPLAPRRGGILGSCCVSAPTAG